MEPSAYVRMARIDHWVKNVFVLPGVLVALSIEPHRISSLNWWDVLIGLLPANERVLENVLGVGHAAHHAVSNREEKAAILVERGQPARVLRVWLLGRFRVSEIVILWHDAKLKTG